MTDREYEIQCPMPDCTEVLFMTWNQSMTLGPEILSATGEDGNDVPTPSDAHTASWQIECAAGHVLLLPGDTGCPCEDDGGGANCPHDDILYDWSDEYRVFRIHDLPRLKSLIAALGGAS